MNSINNIKNILNSDAGFVINENNENEVVDNRFKLIRREISIIKNKDDVFYSELIKLLSVYIDKLYDSKIDRVPKVVFDTNGKLIPQNYDTLGTGNKSYLKTSNHDLSEKLFNYVCEILEKNHEIKLDGETLTRLLNRNPKPFTLAVTVDDYLYRTLNFKKLVEIIDKNQLLKKSNINIDSMYQILIDSYQIDNEDIFVGLIKSEEFKSNNKKIIELLNECSAKYYVIITDIIQRNFDKDFDRLTIAKERKSKNFFEKIIIYLLESHLSESNEKFIHQLLNNPDISINYEFYWADYFGQTSLKERLAFSGKRIIIKDLLSRPENIQNCYWDGDWKIQLYRLYAILGDYEKALALFEKNYNYAYDFTEDYTSGFKDGQARGDFTYSDSLVDFIKNICDSFEKDKIDYIYQKDIINRILNSQNVLYINIDKVLPIIKSILSSEDFDEIIHSLKERNKTNNLDFITVIENNSFYERYTIRIATEEEIYSSLSLLKDKHIKTKKKER